MKIRPEMGDDLFTVTVNMGVGSDLRKFIPIIGEVQLRFGFPNSKEKMLKIVQ